MLLLLLTLLAGRKRLTPLPALLIVLTEIGLVNWAIALNGGASNPYAIILLVPLVIGLIQLPLPAACTVLVASISGQLFQLYPEVTMHHTGMVQHARNMVFGFVTTSLFIAAIISYYRWQLRERNAAILQLRETQLRNEQLLAIGTAAAQLTHDAATPVQTINLLMEEWQEEHSDTLIDEMADQIERLNQLLVNWRQVADDVREAKITVYQTDELIKALRHSLTLARPEANISWLSHTSPKAVRADRTLLPALTNVIINAWEEIADNDAHQAVVSTRTSDNVWIMEITNPVSNLTADSVQSLGRQLVHSNKGNGMASVITNATIEKFAGQVKWEILESEGGTQLKTTVSLPVQS